MTRLFAIAALALLSVGCMRDVTPYPSGWAPLDPHPACSAIAGTYAENVEHEHAPAHMASYYGRLGWLLSGEELAFSGPHLTLSFSQPDVLVIRADRAERRFGSQDGKANCVEGKFQVHRDYRQTPSYFVPIPSKGWVNHTIVLARSVDGWLVAEHQTTDWDFLLSFIPTYMYTVEWYRFAPVQARRDPSSATRR